MPARNRQKRSRKQEETVARRLGGRRVPGSGAGWTTKNDVKTSDLSMELKYTDKKSFSLKHEDLVKAERQALHDGGREFAFLVEFGNGDQYVIISAPHFEGLRHGHPE